jgi:hypothetical protein
MRLGSSFRDPAGYLFKDGGQLFRKVSPEYAPVLDHLHTSGLYEELTSRGLLIPHEEVEPGLTLAPEVVRTISFPYEWCFSQLKDAALTTLEIHRLALSSDLALKDASAYNIQFHHGRPTLIDTLSFEPYTEGKPWRAYRQFCEHFLAPLALMALVDARLNRLLQLYIDGIPLDLAARLLPGKTVLSPGLSMHIHLHAKAQKAGGSSSRSQGVFGRTAMLGLIDSLRGTVEKLTWNPKGTIWADYYENTNYDAQASEQKHMLVSRFLERCEPTCVWDLGANTGEFSRLASERGIHTVAWDFDVAAVEKNYLQHHRDVNLLPLIVDLTNPSPGIGWANEERDSFIKRCDADLVMALALIHHLAIGNNVPLGSLATFFASLSPWTILEFVPKTDSQVQRLLASRDDIYTDYSAEGFERAFGETHIITEKAAIPGSERTLYLLRRK